MTILLTGTHLTPAAATIQALRKKAPGARLVYVGRKHTGAAVSVEREEIERAAAEFAAIESGKFHRWPTWKILAELLKIPAGIWQAFGLIKRYKPDVVVSFGGYSSVPVVLAGKIGGAKIVIHEQTTVWGLANRLLRWIADAVAVSWKEMEGPGAVWTGNPIRQEIVSIQESPGVARRLLSKNPVVYITGGNQGSKAIDRVIEKILPELVEKFEVFHQTKSKIDFKHPRYHTAEWFSTPVHAEILSRAAVSVSRAGANTVTELMYLGVPAILVPLPGSAGGEQEKNARMTVGAGVGRIIEQEELTEKRLIREIREIGDKSYKSYKDYKTERKTRREVVKEDAAEKLADVILSVAKDPVGILHPPKAGSE